MIQPNSPSLLTAFITGGLIRHGGSLRSYYFLLYTFLYFPNFFNHLLLVLKSLYKKKWSEISISNFLKAHRSHSPLTSALSTCPSCFSRQGRQSHPVTKFSQWPRRTCYDIWHFPVSTLSPPFSTGFPASPVSIHSISVSFSSLLTGQIFTGYYSVPLPKASKITVNTTTFAPVHP